MREGRVCERKGRVCVVVNTVAGGGEEEEEVEEEAERLYLQSNIAQEESTRVTRGERVCCVVIVSLCGWRERRNPHTLSHRI
jgi:hypothetical protein